MNPSDFTQLVLGPLGALVIMLAALYLLLRGQIVPQKTFDAELKRNTLLEQENTSLNHDIKELTKQNGQMAAELASLTTEVRYLRNEIEKLQGQVSSGS